MSSNIQYKYFYKTVANLLKKYKRDDILFRTNSSLGHPNKEIESIQLTESKLSKTDKLALEVMINFMGIQGSTSQLPSYILEKLALSDDGGDGWSLLFDFFNSASTLYPLNNSKYPPCLDNPANCSGSPIALITNGAPTFSPLISIRFPPQEIPVVGTILWSLIEIASAPAFFNSFTTLKMSTS